MLQCLKRGMVETCARVTAIKLRAGRAFRANQSFHLKTFGLKRYVDFWVLSTWYDLCENQTSNIYKEKIRNRDF